MKFLVLLLAFNEARFQFERIYKIPSMYNRFKSFAENELLLEKNCGSQNICKNSEFKNTWTFFTYSDDSMVAQRIVDVICKDFNPKDQKNAEQLKRLKNRLLGFGRWNN